MHSRDRQSDRVKSKVRCSKACVKVLCALLAGMSWEDCEGEAEFKLSSRGWEVWTWQIAPLQVEESGGGSCTRKDFR